MTQGAFIVVEGIDGSGTTTVTERLVAHLRARGESVHATCEPSRGPVGALIRQVLSHRVVVPGAAGPRAPGWATMALLFASDRLDHLEAEILPHLHEGMTVVSDRYDLSSLAYQSATVPPSGKGSGDDAVTWIRALNQRARRPDLTLVLDVSARVAEERRGARGASRELYERSELQSRLVRAYAEAELLVLGDRIVHIDADRPLESVVADAVRAIEVGEIRRP
jgi:dTMP kinase